MAGMYLNDSKACDFCGSNAASCNGSDPASCIPGYYLDGKECKICIDAHGVCSNGEVLTACDDGYWINEDKTKCTACGNNVLLCSGEVEADKNTNII